MITAHTGRGHDPSSRHDTGARKARIQRSALPSALTPQWPDVSARLPLSPNRQTQNLLGRSWLGHRPMRRTVRLACAGIAAELGGDKSACSTPRKFAPETADLDDAAKAPYPRKRDLRAFDLQFGHDSPAGKAHRWHSDRQRQAILRREACVFISAIVAAVVANLFGWVASLLLAAVLSGRKRRWSSRCTPALAAHARCVSNGGAYAARNMCGRDGMRALLAGCVLAASTARRDLSQQADPHDRRRGQRH